MHVLQFPHVVLMFNGIDRHFSLNEVVEKTTCSDDATLSPYGVVRVRSQDSPSHFKNPKASLHNISCRGVIHVERLFSALRQVSLPPNVNVISLRPIRC